jgi:hypothetical protein
MVIIRFPDRATEIRGLGFLVGRFSFRTWANGETMVPPDALAPLALEGISYSVHGRATYQHYKPVADVPPAKLPDPSPEGAAGV